MKFSLIREASVAAAEEERAAFSHEVRCRHAHSPSSRWAALLAMLPT
jgi:hypothetical protein